MAVGDSFTEGLDDLTAAGSYRGWADLIARQLAAQNSDFRYANLAVRGRLLGQVVADQAPAALRMAPDLVSFAAGGNDVLRREFNVDRTHATLDRVIGELSATGAQVLMFTIADLATVLPKLIRPRLQIFNNMVRVVAATHRVTLVDLWADNGFRRPQMWSEDRLHLSTYGHRRVAARVLDALGLPGEAQWRAELPSGPAVSWLSARRADLRWTRQHLAPWIYRRLTGTSSGDIVSAKRPELSPFDTAGD
ncbi:MAG: SGNH/GDSL hydrolase family protein [Micromonosporaceae bacterium]